MSAGHARLPLAQDRRLPQRDRLLDPTLMAQIFSQKLKLDGSASIRACQLIRVTYHPGRSIRVAYRVKVAQQQFVIAGRGYPDGVETGSYERESTGSGEGSESQPIVWPEARSLFWIFPKDRKIAHLDLLASPERLKSEISGRWIRSELVSYAPEKCATACCFDKVGEILAYAKIYANDQTETCFRTYAALAHAELKSTELAFPQVACHSPQHDLLLLWPMKGRRLADVEAPDLERGLRKFGAALGCLHKLSAPGHLRQFARTDPQHLRKAAQTIGTVRPELADSVQSISEQLSLTHDSSEKPAFLHGDVHTKNGILLGNRMGLIDLDQAALGSPAADVGSFLAALRYERLIGGCSPSRERHLAQMFLDGYATRSPIPETDRLRWHTAAALVAERAMRAVTRFRAPGLLCLPQLINEAQDVLTKAAA